MSREQREWWVAVLAEEEPTKQRKEQVLRRMSELSRENNKCILELMQLQEQLRECEDARKRLYETAPELPAAKELEDKIAEQYIIVERMRTAVTPHKEKLAAEEARLNALMDERKPFRELALTVDGGVNE